MRVLHKISEFMIIVLGAAMITCLVGMAFFLTYRALNNSSENYQKVITENFQYQALLFGMSNSIRDRMLIVHDLNLSQDAFEVDELSIKYQQLAADFINFREKLLQLGLPKTQLKKLEVLREALRKGRATLNTVVELKQQNITTIYTTHIDKARLINIEVLRQINDLIVEQRNEAVNKLQQAIQNNQRIKLWVYAINSVAFLFSILIIFYVLRLLKHRKLQLDTAIDQLEDSNKNLEQKINARTTQLVALQKQHAKISAEIEVSKELQKVITPHASELKAIKELDVATYIETAESMGGDYVDVLPFQQGYLFNIGDVTDHGLKSGIIMLMVQSMLRHQSNMANTDMAEVLNQLNLSVYQNIQRIRSERYLSLSLLYYRDKQLVITGQHEPIIVVKANGDIENHNTDELGFYIGFIDDVSEYSKTLHLSLEQGDTVILHTDGVTEAANAQEHLYGFERLCEQAQLLRHESAYDMVHGIIHDVNKFVGAKELYDDIALIVFKQR